MKMNSVNKKKLIGQLNIYRSVLILLVICVFATILSPSFLSVANLFNVFKQITVAGIVGCGMTFVILTGGIDLSVRLHSGTGRSSGLRYPGIHRKCGSGHFGGFGRRHRMRRRKWFLCGSV